MFLVKRIQITKTLSVIITCKYLPVGEPCKVNRFIGEIYSFSDFEEKFPQIGFTP